MVQDDKLHVQRGFFSEKITQMVHDSARPNEAIFLQMVTQMVRDSELRPALLIVAVLEFQLTEERRKKVATEAPTMASVKKKWKIVV